MQGNKSYQEKLFAQFQLSERVPKNNFYRKLNEVLDLSFLYARTKPFYGSCGQKSIDPVVFFKLCLVGYFENINRDRTLINHCAMRLDILFFIGYDIDEELPWHSTISRTRQLFPDSIFEELFNHVFTMCVEKGMVAGHSQAIDSAPVKANASMDTLELKVPKEDLETHLQQVRVMSKPDRVSRRKAKENKADQDQQIIEANRDQLKGIESRNKKWKEDQDQRPGASNKGSKYTSNKTHYSPTDPDARISVKPGKARKLNFMSQLSVDTAHHVITDIWAYHADKKDNQYLQDITLRLKQRLWQNGLLWKNCLADTGYSSGENYAFLENQNLESFIPPHGTYKGGPEDFIYQKEENHYICPQGKTIPFKKVFFEKKNNTKKKEYRGSRETCKGCPIKLKCIGKSAHEKRITITYYTQEYERNNARVKSKKGKMFKAKRSSTVEPVFGILTQFRGLNKINTLGIKQANKAMHLSATAYNLKKYLKFISKKVKEDQQEMHAVLKLVFTSIQLQFKPV